MLDYLEMESSEAWDGDSAFDNWDDESESIDSFENARRRRGRGPMRPVPAARGLNAFRPRPNAGATGAVTQAQLQAALARVRTEVTANANGIKTLDGRVRTVATDQKNFETATRKQVDKLRSDLKTTQTLSALVPLISKGTSFENVAPLIHLVGPELMGGTMGASGTSGSSNSGILGGGSNGIIAIGALLYASGAFKPKP